MFHTYTCSLKRFELGLSCTLAAGYDGARMPHAFPFRRRRSGNKRNHRLTDMIADIGSVDLSVGSVGVDLRISFHMLQESDASYSIDFDTKTDTLNAENRVYIDVNYIESTG